MCVCACVCVADGKRGAAGEAAAGVAGLLRDGGGHAGGAAEELAAQEPPPGHPDAGEVAGRLPADPPLRQGCFTFLCASNEQIIETLWSHHVVYNFECLNQCTTSFNM